MKILFIIFDILLITNCVAQADTGFASHWEYKGIAVEERGYHIWSTSPIAGKGDSVHLFVARWPEQYKVDPGWRSHSEIAHYVSANAEGPFIFSDIVLKGTGKNTWDKYGVENPLIVKVGKLYVLFYISNNNYHQPPHPANQKIGMLISKSLYGPWKKVNKDGEILKPPVKETYWNYKATNGVNNPAFLQYKGAYFLYFKSQNAQMGLAISENLKGPYVQLPFPITKNNRTIEDGYAFFYNGKPALLTTDNHGILEKGGGILWQSDDGIHFNEFQSGFHTIDYYVKDKVALKPKWYYGSNAIMKFERPGILLKEGKPAYLYVASGCNIYGGESTISYVLKYKE